MIRVYVDSMIRIPLVDLPEKAKRSLRIRTTHRDPVYAKTRAMGYSTHALESHIKTHTFDGEFLILWRGVLGGVIRTFKRYDLPYKIIDNRLRLPRIDVASNIVLRDYQKAPFEVMRRRQQTVIRAPCGAGKTELMLALVAKVRQPTLVLVWQTSQQKTWLDRIPERFDMQPGGIGGVYKKPKIAPVTIGLVQSVRRRVEDLQGLFGCVLFDEVQRAAASTFSEVINKFPAAYRIGASDDERRKDDREFLIYDSFGPLGWEMDENEGQCDVDIVAVPSEFELNDRAFDHSTVITALTNDFWRNELIMQLAGNEAIAGHTILIFSDRVAHCRYLVKELTKRGHIAGLLIGGKKNEEETARVRQGLQEGRVQIGVGTSIIEQSFHVPRLDRAIMTCASVDYPKMSRFKQMRGRLARPYPGKQSVLYYIWDKNLPRIGCKLTDLRRKYRVTITRSDSA